jgi:hypothetical protein
MILVYLIHRFGGDPRNLESAEHWAAWLTLHFDALFIVPWVPLCRHWPDSGRTRELGLEIDLDALGHCRRAIAVCGLPGGVLSTGGAIEFQEARELRMHPVDCSIFETPEQLEADMDAMARLEREFGRRNL